ncbi:MAG: thioredoxin family protein [Nitrososphaerota archaeon]|jgi:thioredoxin-related protein|nr:thioredoxin family protein [Nitrososphaerota archaeon]
MLKVASKNELIDTVCKHGRVLALFSSSWCPYCQRFAKIFNTHAINCKVDLIVHVDMDDYDSPLWGDYNVSAVPTLIFFENGVIKSRLDAESKMGVTENKFTNWITSINTPK